MNRLSLALLAATAALTAASAKADTRVNFGVHIGIPAYRPAPPTVVYAPAPSVVHAPAARGYWKDITVKTWVPERTYIRHNRWGRPERVVEPGYFTYTTDRVWVATDNHCATPAPAYSYNPRGHDHGYSWNRR
ncbi:MAG: hypothetical protein JNL39_01840 [Opitutaceae bacterium]|nr:hypothetical protein [Opitutaceae bacterium]